MRSGLSVSYVVGGTDYLKAGRRFAHTKCHRPNVPILGNPCHCFLDQKSLEIAAVEIRCCKCGLQVRCKRAKKSTDLEWLACDTVFRRPNSNRSHHSVQHSSIFLGSPQRYFGAKALAKECDLKGVFRTYIEVFGGLRFALVLRIGVNNVNNRTGCC
jgi:hypothetical protein